MIGIGENVVMLQHYQSSLSLYGFSMYHSIVYLHTFKLAILVKFLLDLAPPAGWSVKCSLVLRKELWETLNAECCCG